MRPLIPTPRAGEVAYRPRLGRSVMSRHAIKHDTSVDPSTLVGPSLDPRWTLVDMPRGGCCVQHVGMRCEHAKCRCPCRYPTMKASSNGRGILQRDGMLDVGRWTLDVGCWMYPTSLCTHAHRLASSLQRKLIARCVNRMLRLISLYSITGSAQTSDADVRRSSRSPLFYSIVA